jgi:hypothetical protein
LALQLFLIVDQRKTNMAALDQALVVFVESHELNPAQGYLKSESVTRRPHMAFVNERVPQSDVVKYGLEAINKKAMKGTFEYFWTVDRARDIYLRWMEANRDEPSQQVFWFYWKGSLLEISLDIVSADGQRGGKGSTTWGFTGGVFHLPSNLEPHRGEIMLDLKESLCAYKDFGALSSVVEHTAYFQF